jgi:hypothetical protein
MTVLKPSFSEDAAGGGDPSGGGPPKAWSDWYRFARDELGYEHGERVEYANLRYVEEQNRETLRRSRNSG